MKNIINKYKDIILLLILSILPLYWYGLSNDKIINGVDTGYPFNPLEFIKHGLYVWLPNHAFGFDLQMSTGNFFYHGFEALLTIITNSLFIGQKIYVIAWFFIPMFAIYLCVRRISGFASKQYMALFAAILFQFNLFQFQGWGIIWRTRYSIYAALPILFLLLIDYFENRRSALKTGLYVGLLFFFLNGGGSPPLYGSPILLVLITIFYYLLINLNNNPLTFVKKGILFISVSLLFFIPLSFYWLITNYNYSLSAYADLIKTSGGPTLMLAVTDLVARNATILNLMRLQGLDFLEANSTRDFIRIIMTNPGFIVASFIWPLLAFSSLILSKDKSEKKYILLLSMVAIVGIVFTAGSHEPFREFYLFLLKNIPGFPIFRSSLYKFGELLWFPYTMLIAFTLSTIIEKIKIFIEQYRFKSQRVIHVIALLFILAIFVLDFPIFINFFKGQGLITNMIKVPSYVFEAGRWMDNQAERQAGRILLLPEVSKRWFVEAYNWGYWGPSQVTTFLTRRNTLQNSNVLEKPEQSVVNSMYDLLLANDPGWVKIAKLLSVSHFLLRNDYYNELSFAPTVSPFEYEKMLENNSLVEIEKQIGEWVFYKIKGNNVLPKIYIPDRQFFYTANDEDIPLLISFSDSTGNLPLDDNYVFLSTGKYKTGLSPENDNIVIPDSNDILLLVDKNNLNVPKPKFLPNSPLYFLIENKEKEAVLSKKSSTEQLNLYLGFTLKRLGELKEYLTKGTDLEDIAKVTNRYLVLISDIRQHINGLDTGAKETEVQIIRVKNFLTEEKSLIGSLAKAQKIPAVKSLLVDLYKSVDDIMTTLRLPGEEEKPSEFEEDYHSFDTVFLSSGYRWSVPQDGMYDVYLKTASIMNNSQTLTVAVDGQKAERILPVLQEPNTLKWQNIGNFVLNEGKHGLKITANNIPIYSFRRGDIIFFRRGEGQVVRNGTISQNQLSDLKFNRIDPTKYTASLKSSGPLLLVFGEKFNKNWKLYVKEEKPGENENPVLNFLKEDILHRYNGYRIDENKHFLVNGYANAWLIEGNEKDKTRGGNNELNVVIQYQPQNLLYIGYFVSAVTLICVLIYLFYFWKKSVKIT